MKIRTKLAVVGVVVTGAAVTVGTVAIIRTLRKRRKRVLNRKMRSLMTEILQMRAEDFVSNGSVDPSAFRKLIEKLDNKQLIALTALVQVGYFIKVSDIDPLHPSKADIARAAQKFLIEERAALKSRTDLLDGLDTSDAHGALAAAFGVLSQE